jgi:hypothetical protein
MVGGFNLHNSIVILIIDKQNKPKTLVNIKMT